LTVKTYIIVALAVLAAAAAVLPTTATARDFDCSDFDTRREAQDYLVPGDPHHLDDDGDGIACVIYSG
jgi:Excalibur calcium-binding domain